ncbi:hypothetical protein NQ314_005348 [Rhamnusium bicolor]|uniref:DNA repair protein complementing XP-C cells homolog n=1 Tax=Rhamnusium bicolor TaxID=1586634 RepID=A0AAV8ZHB5_9CUCU|nr:hypothetical protein NQ314_005348 [Rhamnusium bicolor]
MQRSRRATKRATIVESSSDSEDDIPLKKLKNVNKNISLSDKKKINEKNSSSESDIENYLQPVDKIDLNSSFFNIQKKNEEFDRIEKDIFAGVTRLSDSDSDEEMNEAQLKSQKSKQELKLDLLSKPGTSTVSMGTKLNFQQLEEYTRKIEEAKKHIEEYNARKKAEENNIDVSNLLAAGESKQITLENIKPEDLHSSDFESCDSEQEDWEEVKIKDSQEIKEKSLVPKDGLQITLDMPDTCRKKKGVDFLAAMKRRLNRIRKENQIYVHKVHLLCWIAHGNYVNETINNSNILGLALSLLPSDKCYPSDRTDLSYLEQIVQWYKKSIKLVAKVVPKKLDLEEALQLQINKKQAYNKKMFVYIFIAILRSLGIQCRLVISFQVEPLRPPASELHSLAKESTQNSTKGKVSKVEKGEKNPKKTKALTNNDQKNENLSKAKKEQLKNKSIFESRSKESSPNKDRDSKVTKQKREMKTEKSESSKTSTKEFKASSSKSTSKADIEKVEKASTTKKLTHSKDNDNSSVTTNRLTVKKDKNIRSKSADNKLKGKHRQKNGGNSLNVKEVKNKRRSKSVGNSEEKTAHSKDKTKKSIIKIKLPKTGKQKEVPQLDGMDNSSDEEIDVDFVLQLDGADDKNKNKSKTKKPNLKKLSSPVEEGCKVKKHPSRLKSIAQANNSEDEFRPRSPLTRKNVNSPQSDQHRKVNLHKLRDKPLVDKNKTNQFNSPPKNQLDVKNDIINLIKRRIVEQKHIDSSKKVKERKPALDETDSDSDYMPQPIKKKHHDSDSDIDYFVPKPKVKKRVSLQRNQPGTKIISSDSDFDKSGKKKGNDVWVEVFLESEEKWISVDIVQGQVHCVKELYVRKYTARDKEEDDDLNRQQLDQPLPKSIAEYKNHPLYALRRHLLKFEDIYPPNIQPIGYVRGEPVYPRNCVYVCRSRDIWLKEAKVVKLGEKPYKIVKARPKYDKTMDYEPPTAENGVVPRNAFGNVELFKACMLPKGTVHLKLPGLNKICRRMDIDCASAIVGFDFHCGWSHPMYDGFVVCEEFADTLVAAWELKEKKMKKIEKRVYGNWKKLIKGLLIRERLKARYDFGAASTSGEGGKEKKKAKGPKFCTKKRRMYSDSEPESDKT